MIAAYFLGLMFIVMVVGFAILIKARMETKAANSLIDSYIASRKVEQLRELKKLTPEQLFARYGHNEKSLIIHSIIQTELFKRNI